MIENLTEMRTHSFEGVFERLYLCLKEVCTLKIFILKFLEVEQDCPEIRDEGAEPFRKRHIRREI